MEIVCKWKIGCFFSRGLKPPAFDRILSKRKAIINYQSFHHDPSQFSRTEKEKKELKINQKIEGEEFSWLLFNRVWKIRANIGPSKGINCVEARFISRRAEDQPPLPGRKTDETSLRPTDCLPTRAGKRLLSTRRQMGACINEQIRVDLETRIKLNTAIDQSSKTLETIVFLACEKSSIFSFLLSTQFRKSKPFPAFKICQRS